jgi:uncharacterized protein (TIGR02679 family)
VARPDLTGLDRPELAPLWVAVRQRLERSGLELGRSPLVLRDLGTVERDAVAGLLGDRPVPSPRPVRVDPERLDGVLRAGRAGAGVVEVVVALGGPLRDRRGERDRRAAEVRSLWAAAGQHRALVRQPSLAGWLDELRASGLLQRIGGEDPAGVVSGALDVVAGLPVEPAEPLALVAARHLGDAHSLDADRPVGSLVVRALAWLAGSPPPATADERRALFAASGVVVDDLSARVLVLGLRHPGVAWPEEPAWLTLRTLRRAGVSVPVSVDPVVRVCENPSVVAAAADRRGAGAGPLVCTNGVPDAAFFELARHLAAAGVPLGVHADFDHGGLRIAAAVMARTGARPWRYDADEYRRVAHRGLPTLGPAGLPPTPWSPPLAQAMRVAGRAVHEESVVDDLLDDLAG